VAAIVLAHRPKTVEVDDLMQDVAIKLITRLADLRDPAAFRPWLRQVVINVCRGAARSERPTLRFAPESREEGAANPGAGVAAPVSPEESTPAQIDRRDTARRLLEQALTLPPDYREPLLLRCVQSMTYQQISKLLNLPVTTIETRLARARRMLRQEMEDDLEAFGGAAD
jgi:RNA polymerase sigma-70 factor (ECF subfamily)